MMKRSRATVGSVPFAFVLNGALALCCLACSAASSPPQPGSAGDADGGTPPGPLAGVDGGAPVSFGQSEDGIATYYDATGEGACSFDATPDDLDVAAMNAPEFAGSAVCGECVAVTGPKGNVTVRIVDLCPECEKGHLDLSAQAFAKIAKPADGRVAIRWQPVACEVTGNVSYHYKDGSSAYWAAIQVRNYRKPIAKLEVRKSGNYVDVMRASYNYFVDADGTGSDPVHVRLTSSDGQTLEDTLPAAASDLSAPGSGQFN